MSTINVNLMADSQGGSVAPISSVMRNRIINGAMTIDQKNAGASVTPTDGQLVVDRWRFGLNQASKFSAQQSTIAPAGFTRSLAVTSLSAYSLLAGDLFITEQRIEGFNVADLGWGTASAQPVTLSFQVRSSLTGTFGGSIRNSTNGRSYPFTYVINAANTFQAVAITIAGDTAGTWATDNSTGIQVTFGLGVGTNLSGTAGAWASAALLSATGATSVVGTNGATFYITGVQLEKGTQATGFEYRQYGTELALCQRYYWQQGGGQFERLGGGTSHATASQNFQSYPKFPVEMRAIPSISTANITSTQFNGQAVSSVSIDTGGSSRLMAALGVSTSTGSFATGFAFHWETSNAFNVRLTYSAEL